MRRALLIKVSFGSGMQIERSLTGSEASFFGEIEREDSEIGLTLAEVGASFGASGCSEISLHLARDSAILAGPLRM